MSDSQEKSDDLIAELARLMASNAQGGGDQGNSSPVKLPPVAPLASVPPVVRVPGSDKPADAAAQHGPRSISTFDFGKPPAPPAAIVTEPLSNWQAHDATKPAAPEETPKPTDNVTKFEPRVVASTSTPAAPPAPAPTPVASAPEPENKPAAPGEGFNFDFGFGAGTGGNEQKPATEPPVDPIADLIVAELDAAEAAPEHPAEPAKLPHISFGPQPAAVAPQRAPVAPIPVKPVPAQPSAAEADRFTVAPVFGLSSKTPPAPTSTNAPTPQPAPVPPAPAPVAPPPALSADLDPMAEIESLIGEAVRVELEGPARQPAAAQLPPIEFPPEPQPLHTEFAPRRADPVRHAPEVEPAEAAILAAAAATGARIDHVDAPVADDRPYKRMPVKPPRTRGASSGLRQFLGMGVAAMLLLAAGGGLYWVFNMSGSSDPATAPVLTADAAPAKVEPIPAAVAAEPSGSVVFDEINGVAATGDNETLVSRDETAGASVSEVAGVVAPEIPAAGQTSDESTTVGGLANRKVRTVTVRPDGTIVSGDEAVAGIEALPVERPNVPDLPGEDMAPSDLLAAVAEAEPPAAAEENVDPINAIVAEAAEAAEAAQPGATTPAATAPLAVAALDPATTPDTTAAIETTPAVFDASIVSPVPMPRPADRSRLTGGAPQGQFAAVAAPAVTANDPASLPLVDLTTPTAAAPATQVSSRSGAYVQLSSQPSEAEAQRSLQALQSRLATTLNGAALEIRQVEIPGRGTWYRVALPQPSFQDATSTCATIKSNGGDCVAING